MVTIFFKYFIVFDLKVFKSYNTNINTDINSCILYNTNINTNINICILYNTNNNVASFLNSFFQG